MKKIISLIAAFTVASTHARPVKGALDTSGSKKFIFADAWKIFIVKLAKRLDSLRNQPSPNIGLLRFLLSPLNNTAAPIEVRDAKAIDQGDGKLYQVTRRFMPRKASGVHQNKFREYCKINGTGKPYFSDTIKVGFDHVSEDLILDDELLRCMQDGRDTYFTDLFVEHMRTFINDMGAKVARRFVTGGFIGKFAKGGATAFKDLPLFRASSAIAAVNPVGEYILNEDAKQAEISDDLTLIGGTLVDQYRKAQQIASGNDLGFDASLVDQRRAIWRDTFIGQYSGDPDHTVAIKPGAVQLITFLRHKGEFEYRTDVQERITMRDPWFNIEFDVIFKVENCGREIKRAFQFAIIWDLVGYPDCWNGDDGDFSGVTDVYGYKTICSDFSICDMQRAQGYEIGLETADTSTTPAVVECEANCKAAFTSTCGEFAQFKATTLSLASLNISAISVNGLDFATERVYNMAVLADREALSVEFDAKMKSFGGFGYVAESGGGLYTYALTPTTVVDLKLNNDTGADIELVRTADNFVKITSTSEPAGDAVLTDLAWDAPGALPDFNGAPSDPIIGVANVEGRYCEFAVPVSSGGLYGLTITDDSGCTDNITDSTIACDGLTAIVSVTTFDDTNNDDLQGGDPALANVTVEVYTDVNKTNKIAEAVTPGSGTVNFDLEAGNYYIDVKDNTGGTVGKNIITTRPKLVQVGVNLVVTYPLTGANKWSEDGLFPIGN